MKGKHFGWGIFLTFCGALAGYSVHRIVHPLLLGSATMPLLEHFIRPESFSKVETTKALLEALCQRMLVESESKLWVAQRRPSDSAEEQKRELEAMICDLERGMREFAGTDQQMDFVRDLLIVLKHSQNFGRWTDVYLKAIYEHPMHPVAIQLANDALVMSRAVGREDEVLVGLEHLQAIPLDFEGKDRIVAILAAVETHKALTRFDALRNSRQPGSYPKGHVGKNRMAIDLRRNHFP